MKKTATHFLFFCASALSVSLAPVLYGDVVRRNSDGVEQARNPDSFDAVFILNDQGRPAAQNGDVIELSATSDLRYIVAETTNMLNPEMPDILNPGVLTLTLTIKVANKELPQTVQMDAADPIPFFSFVPTPDGGSRLVTINLEDVTFLGNGGSGSFMSVGRTEQVTLVSTNASFGTKEGILAGDLPSDIDNAGTLEVRTSAGAYTRFSNGISDVESMDGLGGNLTFSGGGTVQLGPKATFVGRSFIFKDGGVLEIDLGANERDTTIPVLNVDSVDITFEQGSIIEIVGETTSESLQLTNGTEAEEGLPHPKIFYKSVNISDNFDPLKGVLFLLLPSSPIEKSMEGIVAVAAMPANSFEDDVRSITNNVGQTREEEEDGEEGGNVPQAQDSLALFAELQAVVSNSGAAYDYDSFGAISGANYSIAATGTSFGFACATSGGTAQINDGGGEIEFDSIRTTFFLSQKLKKCFFDVGFQLSRSDYETRRYSDSGAVCDGRTDSWGYGLFANTGVRFIISKENNLSLVPSVGCRYMHSRSESFTENNGVTYDSIELDSLRLRAGATLNYGVQLIGKRKTRFSLDVSYSTKELIDDVANITANDQDFGAQTFMDDTMTFSVFASQPIFLGMTVFAGYFADVTFSGDVTHYFDAGFRMKF